MKSAEFKPSFKTAPVLSLDRDVLLFIFKLNADIFSDENSLKGTRLASQVCRDWRDAILETPSLWGRLIDLDQLVSSTDDWKAEVLRRSGDASLWIRRTGIIFETRPTYTEPIQEFFFSVLNKHWDRIEQLVVSMDVGGLNGELWSAIYRPSPHLRVFSLDLHAFAMDPTSTPSSKTLFSGYAPVLHTFDGAVIQFELQAPWFSSLRSIQLGARLTFSEILHAFNLMPRLESIQIDQAKPINLHAMEMSHLPRLHLQNLHQIRLSSNLTTCAAFLEYITPAHGCSINIHAVISPDESPIDSGHFATFVRRLSKLAGDLLESEYSHRWCLPM
ncbi:hypothetical protein GALMADRAFT_159109 [Galerina marginata CBS 339.88]|uniref:Uncharacterized protein n=1 Tax=Galerina marginata (strain CBS 339.88) TaxID=685588 RepID=A0A067SM69_GALM3|nr:hypothetical protein GALMADRAFT_159109 [Galerina marginata CBS 339.88]